MSWTNEQCERLAAEKKLIDLKFPGFVFVNPKDNNKCQVEGEGNTRTGLAYKLRITVPPNFPDLQPHLYVVVPNPLRTYHGQSTIASLGSRHEFHTHQPDTDGCVCICYTNNWHPGMTIAGAICKGVMWLEAYSYYLRTGKSIDYILKNLINRIFDQRLTVGPGNS